MNYEITDKRLYEIIYKFINNEFVSDNLDYEHDINPDTEEPEKNIFNFFGDKYHTNDQDEWTFQYVKKEYYENLDSEDFKNRWLHKAPLLEVTDRYFPDKMKAFFNDYWKPVFEKWFENNFPQFPVETYIYH